MSQTLTVELAIAIPEDSIIIKKTEYSELQKDSLKGRRFTLAELSERTGIPKHQITKIFDKPKVKQVADAERGGFVVYPQNMGSPYLFLASATIQFIDENFSLLFSGE